MASITKVFDKPLEEAAQGSSVALFARDLSRFDGLGHRVLLQFTDLSLSFISGTSDQARVVEEVVLDARNTARLEEKGGLYDCIVKVSHPDLLLLNKEELEPRLALFLQSLRADGDPAIAVRLYDRFQGKRYVNSDPNLSQLPRLTTDLDEARQDLRDAGYCLIQDALSPDHVKMLKDRVYQQMQGETAAGIAYRDGGKGTPNHRIWNLVNKGRVFLDLLDHPTVRELAPEYVGDHAQIFSYTANVAGPGGEPMALHTDQSFAQPAIPIQLGINFVFFLDDVTAANGGTRLIPASHKPEIAPDNPLSIDETIAAEGPAGTMLVFDSRLWHGTGPNMTKDQQRCVLLMFLTRHFIRPMTNALLTLDPEVESKLTDHAKGALGFICSNGIGGGENGPQDGLVSRVERPITAMTDDGAKIPFDGQERLSW